MVAAYMLLAEQRTRAHIVCHTLSAVYNSEGVRGALIALLS